MMKQIYALQKNQQNYLINKQKKYFFIFIDFIIFGNNSDFVSIKLQINLQP